MRLRILIAVLAAAGLLAAQQVNAAPPCDTSWTAGDGTWGTAASWDHGLPNGNVACIPAGVTVTHNIGADTITTLLSDGTLRITGGTLTIDGTADPSNTAGYEQTGGTLGGAATLQLTNGGIWSGGQMIDAGTTTVAAGKTLTLQTLSVGMAGTRVLDIAGTVLIASTDRGINWNGGTPRIVVEGGGVLRKTVGSATATPTTSFVGIPVENDGKVESVADKGNLALTDGSGATSSGTYGSAGALGGVQLSGGTHTLGDGAKLLAGAVITGTVDVAGAATATASNASMTAGTLGGAGTFSLTGPFSWTGGQMAGAGTTDVASGVTATLASLSVGLAGTRVLDIAGTVLIASTDRGINWNGGTPRIVVEAGGVLRKTVGSATATPTTSFVGIPVENDGKVESVADKGVLALTDGSGGTSSGTYGSAGALGGVQLSGGTHTLGDGANLLDGAQLGGTETIPAGANVTATGARMTGGTLGGAGDLTVASGTFTWSGGTANGAGATTVSPGATMAVTSSVNLGGTRRLDVGGLFDVQTDATIGNGTTSLIHVLAGGTMRKTGGTGAFGAFVIPPLRNDGLVETTSGNLRLNRGADIPSTGTFHGLDASHHVILGGTGHQLAGSAHLGDFTELAGGVAIADGQTLTVLGEIFENGGTLTGDLTLSGTLHWLDGVQGAGATTITPAGQVLIENTCFDSTIGDGRRVVNQGLISLTGQAGLSLGFGDTPPVIENAGTIRLADVDNSNCSTGILGDGLIHNAGTLEKTGAAQESDIGPALDNDGTVRVTAGLLRLRSDGAFEQSGTFTSSGTGTYVLDQGVFLLAPGASLEGKPVVGSGDLRIPGEMTLTVPAGATLVQTGGVISGAGTLRVLGTLEISDGNQSGGGTTLIEPGGAATVASAAPPDPGFLSLDESRALVNAGTLTVDTADLAAVDGASVTNRGTMILKGESALGGGGFGNGFSGLLHNTGTLRKEGASTVESGLAIDNDGTIEVTGGKLDAQELLNFTSDFSFGGPHGALVGGDYVLRGAKLGVPDDVEVIAARVVLDGAASGIEKPTFGQGDPNALTTLHRIAGGGELELAGARTLDSGTGTGTFSNAGVLRLGPGSTFDAVEGYSQTPGAVLRPEIAAPAVGRLAVTGAAALAGRLDVISTVPPADGTDVTVVSYGSHTGQFGTITGATGYVPRYDADGVKLHRGAANVAAPPAAVEAPPKGVVLESARLGISALTVEGPWAQRGGYLIATRRGATLTRRNVSGRGLDIVARTGPRAGAVKVSWAGRSRTLSLRSATPRRRTIRVLRLARTRKGTVVVRTRSARRVAIASLVVRR